MTDFLVVLNFALDQPYRVLVEAPDIGICANAVAAIHRAIETAQVHYNLGNRLIRSIEVTPIDRKVEA